MLSNVTVYFVGAGVTGFAVHFAYRVMLLFTGVSKLYLYSKFSSVYHPPKSNPSAVSAAGSVAFLPASIF